MDRLPVELLTRICQYLQAPPYKPNRDLLALGQVSRFYHELTTLILYETITLKFGDEESLQSAVSEVMEGQDRRHFQKYARKLYVVCIPTGASRREDPEAFKAELKQQSQPLELRAVMDRYQATIRNDFLDDWMNYDAEHPDVYIGPVDPGSLPFESRNWAPVESLIASLNRLDQFSFIVNNQFTSGLVQAISHYHPNCRVDIPWQQCLDYRVFYQGDFSEHLESFGDWLFPQYIPLTHAEVDNDILSLPGLHSLTVNRVDYSSHDEILNGPQAMDEWEFGPGLQVQAGVLDEILPFILTNPGLKHLRFERSYRHILPEDDQREALCSDTLKKAWKMTRYYSPPKQQSQLESLMAVHFEQPQSIILKLAAVCDLSSVRILVLGPVPGKSNDLTKLAGLFPNLERLFIILLPKYEGARSYQGSSSYDRSDLENNIIGIRAFQPLKYLRLDGIVSPENLHRAIEPHGQSLRGLMIGSWDLILESSDIELLAAKCPNLEELRIDIKRSKGDQRECQLYKALGKFSKFRTLLLDLDCNMNVQERRHLLGELPDIYPEFFPSAIWRDLYINAAVDEKLALGIWNLITSNKSSRLQKLHIQPKGGGCHFDDPERNFIDGLTRKYIIKRSNFQDPGSLVVKEAGGEMWEIPSGPPSVPGNPDPRRRIEIPLESETLPIIKELWPHVQTTQGSCLVSQFTSFPLETGTV